MKPIIRLLGLAALIGFSGQVRADNGIAPDAVSFAQVAALDGPAAAPGTGATRDHRGL